MIYMLSDTHYLSLIIFIWILLKLSDQIKIINEKVLILKVVFRVWF